MQGVVAADLSVFVSSIADVVFARYLDVMDAHVNNALKESELRVHTSFLLLQCVSPFALVGAALN